MPSETPKQARTMAAAAHNPKFAKKVGIPQKVAKEFNEADKGTGIIKSKNKKKNSKPEYKGDQKDRLQDVKTDRGTFRFKSNKKGD